MLSFGDNTLQACISTEKRNGDTLSNFSSMDKYFEESAFLSKITEAANNVPDTKESNQKLCNLINKESRVNNDNSTKEPNINIQSKLTTNATILNHSKRKGTTSLRKMCSIPEAEKENANFNFAKNDVSSRMHTLRKRFKKTELTIDNSNIVHNEKIANSGASLSSSDKSLELCASVSIVPTQDQCKLASWGLPPNILQKYEARGVINMFPWQVECLSNHKVIQEKCNLVYSAPTSAGKTLVAEILMIKAVLEWQKKALFILPFVSVVREKMYYFQDLLSDSGIRVEGFMGGVLPPGGFAATHIAIATIEKANSLVNRLMEENELANLGAVVIDELHLVGDSNRGYLLELLLTKLKYMTFRNENISVQLIGMSATLPNLPLLAKWLDAELYKTDFRPVPLNEQCKIGKSIYDNNLRLIRNLTPLPELTMDSEDILYLCIETISDGHSILIFCPTKNWCEKLAQQIANSICKLGQEDTQLGQTLRQQLDATLISETLEQLKRSPVGLDSVLKNVVSFGTAFHHAGLTMDERDIIEGSFRSGSLRVLVATSTLSSGVNLPARRVLVRSPMFGGKVLDSLTYRQMIGRAGRMGKDTAGESILICTPSEQRAAKTLLSATLKPIESCLKDSGPLIRALLEAIASEVVYTPLDVQLYINCTLLSLSNDHESKDLSEEAIQFLVDNEFLLLQNVEAGHRWVATAFGKACLAASIPPRDGLFLLEELQKARRCFVLDTELHVVYLVTPLGSGNQIGAIDWMTFLELWKTLSESERRVGQLVGIEEGFLTSAISGVVYPGKSLNIHKRFYTALALHDLVREVPLNVVCKKYGCCRGVLQTLQQSASTFAGMVTQFCKELGWDCLELLVSQFQTRLQFGVCRELLDLLRLPMLNGLRARSLYKHGITSVADLAVANELDVERALYKALPFESEKEQDGEHELEAAKRNKMRTVFVTGKDGLTPHEAAVILVQEARTLVQNELGLQDMSWKPNERSITASMSNTETSLETRENILQSTKHTLKEIVTNNSSQYKINLLGAHQAEHIKRSGLSITHEDSRFTNSEKILLNHKIIEHEMPKDNGNVINNDSINSLKDDGIQQEKVDIAGSVPNFDEDTKNSINHLQSKEMLQERRSNDDNITDQLLQIDIPECTNTSYGKMSFDIFDDSSPRMAQSFKKRRNSDSLIMFNDNKKNHLQTNTIKHHTCNIKSAQNICNISFKKIRVSDEAELVNGSSFNNDKLPLSRSPSLFDDSLNLDSQICNILEQNIADCLQLSDLEDSKLSQWKATSEDGAKATLQTSHNINEERVEKNETLGRKVIDIKNTQTKDIVLSWYDDSWNDSKKVTELVNQIKGPSTKCTVARPQIRSIKNTNLQYTAEHSSTNNCTQETKRKKSANSDRSVDIFNDTKKTSQSRRLKEGSNMQSPIASVVTFDKNRVPSIDLDKSDSDDVIITSQNVNTPSMCNTIRNKLHSEKKIKGYTQKISSLIFDDQKLSSKTPKAMESQKYKIKPKLKDIRTHNTLSSKNPSAECAVSNSNEDSPIKTTKPVQTSKISLRNLRLNSKTCAPDNGSLNNINETTNWKILNIIKVGSDRGTFNLFRREVMQKHYIALALNCELYNNEISSIGAKVVCSTSTGKKKPKKVDNYIHNDTKLCGAAIAWENNIAYYISFSNHQDLKVPGREQMKLLKEILSNSALHVKCFATKETFKMLYNCCGITSNCKFLDPKIASWLYDGTAYDKTFNEMVNQHFPSGCFMIKKIGSCYDVGPGLDIKNVVSGECRASTEAILTWHITDTLMHKLEQLTPTLLYTFKDVEMKNVILLACMELTGIGVSIMSLQELSSIIREEMKSLEERAYTFCGKKFNFSSSKEVAEVLGLYKGKKISVNKGVLEQCDHPLSNLIMSWRKLSATQSKIIYPVLCQAQHESRIHGNSVTCTVTGRISMHEPNLQNVPKDFTSEDNSFTISVRMAFIPAPGNVMLSADYCQLELRILAHFSRDQILCDIMRKPGDIFRNIAANWNHTSEDQIDDKMRQNAKQLCYGMIYGMGAKTLAENLSVDEEKAKEFLKSFMSAYPGISKWINEVIQKARTNGYITTLFGRRRMLPGLTSTNATEKSQAERQAVNTKVQGSAADIAKKAMINIEERMQFEFPASPIIMPTVSSARKLRSKNSQTQKRGAYLVLQMHDELLYEVNMSDLKEMAVIIKESMEQVCQLAVPLPVKVKVGPAWGDLSEYNFFLDK